MFWNGPYGTTVVSESDLRLYAPSDSPAEAFVGGQLAGYYDFQRLMKLQRLLRDEPLRNNIYAFNAPRTQFFPYQFKPLLKFIDSPRNRLLICDEVSLGKTIEAGLIMLELRVHQTVRLTLVVCPSNLREKWRLELRQRFGEEFRVFDAHGFMEWLGDYEEAPDRVSLNGVVSIETIRQFGHLAARRGPAVTQAVVMLSATPVQLGLENLFSCCAPGNRPGSRHTPRLPQFKCGCRPSPLARPRRRHEASSWSFNATSPSSTCWVTSSLGRESATCRNTARHDTPRRLRSSSRRGSLNSITWSRGSSSNSMAPQHPAASPELLSSWDSTLLSRARAPAGRRGRDLGPRPGRLAQ